MIRTNLIPVGPVRGPNWSFQALLPPGSVLMEASFMYLPAEFLYQSQSTSLCQSFVSTRSALRSPLIQRCIFDPSEGKIGKVESRRLCVPDALDLLHIFKGGMKKFPARGLRLRAQFFSYFGGRPHTSNGPHYPTNSCTPRNAMMDPVGTRGMDNIHFP